MMSKPVKSANERNAMTKSECLNREWPEEWQRNDEAINHNEYWRTIQASQQTKREWQ